jgi:hypothetical protein
MWASTLYQIKYRDMLHVGKYGYDMARYTVSDFEVQFAKPGLHGTAAPQSILSFIIAAIILGVTTLCCSQGPEGDSGPDVSVDVSGPQDLRPGADHTSVEVAVVDGNDTHELCDVATVEMECGEVLQDSGEVDWANPEVLEAATSPTDCGQPYCSPSPNVDVALWLQLPALVPRNLQTGGEGDLALAFGAIGGGTADTITVGDFGTFQLDDPAQLIVVSLNLADGVKWLRTVEKGGSCWGRFSSISYLPDGNLFWADSWDPGTSDLPGPPLDLGGEPIEHHGYTDIFVTRIDSQGQHVWSQGFGGEGGDCVFAVGTGAMGYMYFGGTYVGSGMDLGSGGLISDTDAANFYFARLGSDGEVGWSFATEGMGYSGVHTLATGDLPGLIVTLGASQTLTLGGVYLEKIGPGGDSVIARIGPDADVLWAKRFGTVEGTNPMATNLIFGAEGRWTPHGHYVYGRTSHGSIDFGLGPLVEGASEEHAASLVLRLDADGNTVWNKYLGVAKPPGSLAPVDITQYDLITGTVDSADTFYLSGEYVNGPLDWPGVVQDNEEGYGYFLARFDVQGEVMWAVALNGLVASIAEGPDGTMYAYGSVKEDMLRVNEQEFPVPEGEGNKLFVLSFKP